MLDFAAEKLTIRLEDLPFSWNEVLGLSGAEDATSLRHAWTSLAVRYHPDKGGPREHMIRVNRAYEVGKQAIPNTA